MKIIFGLDAVARQNAWNEEAELWPTTVTVEINPINLPFAFRAHMQPGEEIALADKDGRPLTYVLPVNDPADTRVEYCAPVLLHPVADTHVVIDSLLTFCEKIRASQRRVEEIQHDLIAKWMNENSPETLTSYYHKFGHLPLPSRFMKLPLRESDIPLSIKSIALERVALNRAAFELAESEAKERRMQEEAAAQERERLGRERTKQKEERLEAEKQAREEWCKKFGSPYLQNLITLGYLHDPWLNLYRRERIAAEFPGWSWIDDVCGHEVVEPTLPPPSICAQFIEAQKQDATIKFMYISVSLHKFHSNCGYKTSHDSRHCSAKDRWVLEKPFEDTYIWKDLEEISEP
jgi:hypothetical protein